MPKSNQTFDQKEKVKQVRYLERLNALADYTIQLQNELIKEKASRFNKSKGD